MHHFFNIKHVKNARTANLCAQLLHEAAITCHNRLRVKGDVNTHHVILLLVAGTYQLHMHAM